MPYTEAHNKITVWGDAYNGAEQWSFGWRMRAVDPDDADAQRRADALAPIVSAFWTRSSSPRQLSTHRLQGVKVAIITPEGTYPDDSIAGEVFFANVPGGVTPSSTDAFLPQGSICVTLATARPRGLASKGRFFLPPTDTPVGSDGLMPENYRDAMVTAAQNFLNAVNQIDAGNANIAIFSRGKGEKAFNAATGKIEWTYPNEGRTEIVTRVEVGKVIDTQRRRRRQLTESREGAVLTQ